MTAAAAAAKDDEEPNPTVRPIIDLIDIHTRKNIQAVEMRWILMVNDHSTGITYLAALPLKQRKSLWRSSSRNSLDSLDIQPYSIMIMALSLHPSRLSKKWCCGGIYSTINIILLLRIKGGSNDEDTTLQNDGASSKKGDKWGIAFGGGFYC